MNVWHTLIVGNLKDGFKTYGPFFSRDSAIRYAWASGIQAHEQNWVMEVREPETAAFGTKPHLVLFGNPLRGWLAVGPFADPDEAAAWVDKNLIGDGDETTVLPILNPKTGK